MRARSRISYRECGCCLWQLLVDWELECYCDWDCLLYTHVKRRLQECFISLELLHLLGRLLPILWHFELESMKLFYKGGTCCVEKNSGAKKTGRRKAELLCTMHVDMRAPKWRCTFRFSDIEQRCCPEETCWSDMRTGWQSRGSRWWTQACSLFTKIDLCWVM